ncbi:hypothetical protein C7S13_7571 [Burkholderia cepacia]|nr:hypothetical protein [Burkholderia cepacia]
MRMFDARPGPTRRQTGRSTNAEPPHMIAGHPAEPAMPPAYLKPNASDDA